VAEAQKLSVSPRIVLGKKVNALRRKGILPGVVFGGDASSLPVEMEQHTFELSYRRWGNTTLLSLTGLDGGEVPALIHDVSRDPVSGRMLHVEFARVSLTEKTHADVPLHFVKESPAVKTLGAVLLHALSEVTVEAFPQDIPRSIEVDISGLQEIDDEIFVRDLRVDPTVIQITNDPEELVVKVVPARVEEEKPAEAAAPAEGEEAAEGEGAAAAAGTEPAKAGAAPGAGAKPAAGGAAKPAASGAAKPAAAAAPKAPSGGGAKKA
jgi:large subunit ribosomal protein L25